MLQLRGGARRLQLGLGDNAKKTAIAYHGDHAGQRTHFVEIHRQQLRTWCRGPHHAAMHHARQHKVVNQAWRAENLFGQITARRGAADHAVLRGGLGRERGARIHVEIDHCGECTKAGGRVGILGIGVNAATFNAQLIAWYTQLRGRSVEKQCARMRGNLAQRCPRLLDRQAARGHSFIGAGIRCSRNHAHLVERDIEFFRRDLCERGDDALADLDLAGHHVDQAIAMKAQPLIEARVDREAGGADALATGVHARVGAGLRRR